MSIAGVWVNEYGSKMDLGLMNSNLIMGTYQSSTGSTGTYMVIGLQQTDDQTPAAGQAVALAIEWHSVVAGPPDNSWHWVSGLSGQISVENGADTLILAHAMVASDDFPGLAATGVYIDKLTYTRSSEQSQFKPMDEPGTNAAVADPMSGTWKADDGTVLVVQIYPYTNNAFGWIQGTLTMSGGQSMIYGVTDINATSGSLQFQSAAITGLTSFAGPAIAFAGTLDLSSETLTLLDLSSQSTAPNATYVQTQVSTKTFVRV
jgi:hypothetical protein